MDLNLENLLPQVLTVAQEAGELILSIVKESADIDVKYKQDNTPVTQVDQAANDFIVTALQTLTPTIPIVAEEASHVNLARIDADGAYWLVDPLDGTKGFIAGSDQYTVNIALIYERSPVLGVIVAPALQQAYYAMLGKPAYSYLSAVSKVIRISTAAHARRILLSHTIPWNRLAARVSRGMLLAKPGRMNSSLKFCAIADGEYDFYPRLGPTSLWDSAAGQVILEQAGGAVIDLDGNRLQYHLNLGLLNPAFIALGDSAIMAQVLALAKDIRSKI